MEPSNKTTAGFELPAPPAEVVPPATGEGELALPTQEQAPANAEREPVSAAAIAQPASTIPLPRPPAGAQPADDVATTTPVSTPVAADDDDDLIEKEWVEKAKQIVEHTRDDPHKQSQELTVFKADYMKKRYGKAVKLT